MSMTAPEPSDGRTARARRTREAIVDATISLLERGDYRPTAPRIAEDAGVSVRSVFQHFDDLETLHTAVAARTVERVRFLLLPIDSDLPREERLDRLVRQRVQLLEAITPIRRAAGVHEPFSPEIGRWLSDGQEFLRREITDALPELTEGADRSFVVDAIDAALSWPTWDMLRSRTGRSVEDATRVVRLLIDGALSTVPRPA